MSSKELCILASWSVITWKMSVKIEIVVIIIIIIICVCMLCSVKNITVSAAVTLNCSTSSNVDVKWTHTDKSSVVYDIYFGGEIFENIRNRFSINSTIPSHYDLVVLRANPSDAGHYVCDERNPADGSRTVLSHYFLTVLGNTIVLLLYFVTAKQQALCHVCLAGERVRRPRKLQL